MSWTLEMQKETIEGVISEHKAHNKKFSQWLVFWDGESNKYRGGRGKPSWSASMNQGCIKLFKFRLGIACLRRMKMLICGILSFFFYIYYHFQNTPNFSEKFGRFTRNIWCVTNKLYQIKICFAYWHKNHNYSALLENKKQ